MGYRELKGMVRILLFKLHEAFWSPVGTKGQVEAQMRYWLNTATGEWGIVRGSERNEIALSGPVGPLVVNQEAAPGFHEGRAAASGKSPDLLVLEKAVFLKIYETLERLSFTPVYSPVQPLARN
jgi:hypothetical protein